MSLRNKAGLSLVGVILLYAGLDYACYGKSTKARLRDMEQAARSLPVPAGSREIDFESSWKPNHALVIRKLQTPTPSPSAANFYLDKLEQEGWIDVQQQSNAGLTQFCLMFRKQDLDLKITNRGENLGSSGVLIVLSSGVRSSCF